MRTRRSLLRLALAVGVAALALAARPAGAEPDLMPDCERRCDPVAQQCLLDDPLRYDYCRGIFFGCVAYCERYG